MSDSRRQTPAAANGALIRSRFASRPRIGIVLGSGLGGLVGDVIDAVQIPYRELTGFPATGVSGHAGHLVLGHIGSTPVAVLAGRAHYYEEGNSGVMRPALETLKEIGVETLILTNAAGSVQRDITPGSIMLIVDHISFARNPLIGETTDARFVGMTRAYDRALMEAAREAAAAEGVTLAEGVYMWLSGPSFETPAEIRAAKILGADAVGMSTVPEVILARFLGLSVLAFSVITNYGAGMTDAELSHEETKAVAPLGGGRLQKILSRLIGLTEHAASGKAA